MYYILLLNTQENIDSKRGVVEGRKRVGRGFHHKTPLTNGNIMISNRNLF